MGTPERADDAVAETTDRRSESDRRLRFRSRLRERRSGFERREIGQKGPRAAYYRALKQYGGDSVRFWTVLATIVVFNFIDLMLTIDALGRGAVEANPVMRSLFWAHPLTAALVKIGVVAAVVLFLQRMRRYRAALELAFIMLIGFTARRGYHSAVAIGGLGEPGPRRKCSGP